MPLNRPLPSWLSDAPDAPTTLRVNEDTLTPRKHTTSSMSKTRAEILYAATVASPGLLDLGAGRAAQLAAPVQLPTVREYLHSHSRRSALKTCFSCSNRILLFFQLVFFQRASMHLLSRPVASPSSQLRCTSLRTPCSLQSYRFTSHKVYLRKC